MFSKKSLLSNKYFLAFLSTLALSGYSIAVLAAAPVGGYLPGETLQPDCIPGSSNCYTRQAWQQNVADGFVYNDTDMVGIGTDTPTATLDVLGDLNIQTDFSGGIALIKQGDLAAFGGDHGLAVVVSNEVDVTGLFRLDYNSGSPLYNLFLDNATNTIDLTMDSIDGKVTLSSNSETEGINFESHILDDDGSDFRLHRGIAELAAYSDDVIDFAEGPSISLYTYANTGGCTNANADCFADFPNNDDSGNIVLSSTNLHGMSYNRWFNQTEDGYAHLELNANGNASKAPGVDSEAVFIDLWWDERTTGGAIAQRKFGIGICGGDVIPTFGCYDSISISGDYNLKVGPRVPAIGEYPQYALFPNINNLTELNTRPVPVMTGTGSAAFDGFNVSGSAMVYSYDSKNLFFYTDTDEGGTNAWEPVSPFERDSATGDTYLFDVDDNVGIGTDTPAAKLDVVGDFQIQTAILAGGVSTKHGDLAEFGGDYGFATAVLDDFLNGNSLGLSILDNNGGDPIYTLGVSNGTNNLGFDMFSADGLISMSALDTNGAGSLFEMATTANLLGGNQYFDLSASYVTDPDKTVGFEAQEGIDGLKAKMYYSTVLGSSNIQVIEVGPENIVMAVDNDNVRTVFNTNGVVFPGLAADPAGEEGAIYYDTVTEMFRGYRNSAWQNLSFSSLNETALGDVGIGTTATTDKLEVFGDIRVGTSSTNGCLKDFSGGTITGTCSSDERLKANIQPVTNILDKLTNINLVTYDWNDIAQGRGFKGGTSQLGVLAQNVEQYFPELVVTDKDGYKQVNYGRLNLLTMQAIKELNLKVAPFTDFANIIKTKKVETEELCIKDVCLSRDQLYQIIQEHSNNQGGGGQLNPTPAPAPEPTPEPEITPEPTPTPPAETPTDGDTGGTSETPAPATE